MTTIEEFTAQVRAGAEHASSQERRRIYELLKLRGRVRTDPEGDTLGVWKGTPHRFAVEWASIIPLDGRNRGLLVKKGRSLAVIDVDITAPDGKLVAKGRASYALRQRGQ